MDLRRSAGTPISGPLLPSHLLAITQAEFVWNGACGPIGATRLLQVCGRSINIGKTSLSGYVMGRRKDRTAEKKAFAFLTERLKSRKPFTIKQLARACGWEEATPRTYLRKHWYGLVEKTGPGVYIVKNEFARLTLDAFLRQGTQVKEVFTIYERRKHEHLVIYEFLLPLTQEERLRRALDELFFRDSMEHRLKEVGIDAVGHFMNRTNREGERALIRRTLRFAEAKIGGYSISHVSGRFRAAPLMTRTKAMRSFIGGASYLIDETTALVRFIIPCDQGRKAYTNTAADLSVALDVTEPKTRELEREIRQVRWLFHNLFVEAVTRTVPEQEVWLLEQSPFGQRLYVWART